MRSATTHHLLQTLPSAILSTGQTSTFGFSTRTSYNSVVVLSTAFTAVVTFVSSVFSVELLLASPTPDPSLCDHLLWNTRNGRANFVVAVSTNSSVCSFDFHIRCNQVLRLDSCDKSVKSTLLGVVSSPSTVSSSSRGSVVSGIGGAVAVICNIDSLWIWHTHGRCALCIF